MEKQSILIEPITILRGRNGWVVRDKFMHYLVGGPWDTEDAAEISYREYQDYRREQKRKKDRGILLKRKNIEISKRMLQEKREARAKRDKFVSAEKESRRQVMEQARQNNLKLLGGKKCRHCGRVYATRTGRGLCRPCWNKKEIKDKYAIVAPWGGALASKLGGMVAHGKSKDEALRCANLGHEQPVVHAPDRHEEPELGPDG